MSFISSPGPCLKLRAKHIDVQRFFPLRHDDRSNAIANHVDERTAFGNEPIDAENEHKASDGRYQKRNSSVAAKR